MCMLPWGLHILGWITFMIIWHSYQYAWFYSGYILPLMSIIKVVSLVLVSMLSNLFLKYHFIVLSHEVPLTWGATHPPIIEWVPVGGPGVPQDQMSPRTCGPRTSCPPGRVVLGPHVPCQDKMSPLPPSYRFILAPSKLGAGPENNAGSIQQCFLGNS